MKIDPTRDALVVVDLQNDFCPGGALAVRGGDAIVPVVNRYLERFEKAGAPMFLTRDWHPEVTTHFKAYGGIWPPHCVQGTRGAEFHPGLKPPARAEVVSKGMDPTQDSYSAFHAEDESGRTLPDCARRRGVSGGSTWAAWPRTTACAPAPSTRLNEGFEVVVLTDAIGAVDLKPGDGARAMHEMQQAGAKFATMDDVGI